MSGSRAAEWSDPWGHFSTWLVTLFDAKDKGGGLNEYGIAAYKTVDGFAQAEVDFILGVGNIALKTGVRLGRDVTLAALRAEQWRLMKPLQLRKSLLAR